MSLSELSMTTTRQRLAEWTLKSETYHMHQDGTVKKSENNKC